MLYCLKKSNAWKKLEFYKKDVVNRQLMHSRTRKFSDSHDRLLLMTLCDLFGET